MRFNITRLCGGKALMASPADNMDIDLDSAAETLGEEFTVVKNEAGMMLVMSWKDMELTLYTQGKIMFHPLSDKDLAIEYATYILNKLGQSV